MIETSDFLSSFAEFMGHELDAGQGSVDAYPLAQDNFSGECTRIVRKAARNDGKAQFTALLHRLTVDRLRESFYASTCTNGLLDESGCSASESAEGHALPRLAPMRAIHKFSYFPPPAFPLVC